MTHSTEEPGDDALMRAYTGGDQAAFAALYARHKGAAYRYFRRQLTEDQANDCFQELWLRIVRYRGRYRANGLFTAYLFKLAHNVLMDHFRRTLQVVAGTGNAGTEAPFDEAHASDGSTDGLASPTPAQQLDRERLRDKLHELLAQLPAAQREVWILKQETTLGTREIAALTDTTEEGVKSRLRYATRKLKAGLAPYVSAD